MIRGVILPQPEATLVVFGIRQFTRHADNRLGTELRSSERVAIISSHRYNREDASYRYGIWLPAWQRNYGTPLLDEFPLGCVVGIAAFTGSAPIERVYSSISWRDQVTEDWYNAPGFSARWSAPQRLATPFSVDGKAIAKDNFLQLSAAQQEQLAAQTLLPAPPIPRLAPHT